MQSLPQGSAVSIESLLAHADWVRALARQLVSDPASADDVEQEVWRAAIENPPRDGSNPRGWLASVARNAARTLGRANSRREAREQRNARAEALPATSELVAEAELARELAGEVLALEEPYRTVLLLRFWRALSPEEIAHAQSISRETVRTQLKRGLERLRERLDRRFGDREKWLAAIAPLARESTLPLPGVAAGGMLALLLKCGVAASLAAGVWWAWPTRTEHGQQLANSKGTADVQPVETGTAHARETESATLVSSGARAPVSSPLAHALGLNPALHGRILDLEGRPVAGIELEWHSSEERERPHWEGDDLHLKRGVFTMPSSIRQLLRQNPAELERFLKEFGEPGAREAILDLPVPRTLSHTGGDGVFDIELGQGTWTSECTDPHRMIVARMPPREATEWTLLCAPCAKLAGRVVDEDGQPVQGAHFNYTLDLSRLDAFSDRREDSWQWNMLGAAEQDGTFSLERVPARPEIHVEVQATGFSDATLAELGTDDPARRIVLARRVEEDKPAVRGRVIDERGIGVAQVTVSLGQDQTSTDEQGLYTIRLSIGHPGEALTAVKRGFQPAILLGFGEQSMQSRSEVLLRLGPPALSIEGHVRLPDGSNPGGCHVQIVDGTPFGSTQCMLEDVAAGRYSIGVDTDDSGQFMLEGLCARDYRLLAYDPRHGQIALTDPINAGSKDVLVQGRPGDFLPRLTGRVLDRHHVPLDGVELSLAIRTYEHLGSTSETSFGKVRSDAQGGFELTNVPRKGSRIGVGGRGIHQETRDLSTPLPTELELVVALEVRTRLEIADPLVDEVQFLDDQGHTVHAMLELPHSNSMREAVPLIDGKFPTFEISDAAASAVLMRGRTEVRRVPVEIRREKLLTLRF